MTIVDWLQNLLHSISLTTVLIVLGYLVCLFLIMALMKAKGRADRKANLWERIHREHLGWEERRANSAGPEVTAKTLTEDNA